MTEATICRPLPSPTVARANRYASVTIGRKIDAPLRGLEGSDLSARFRHWRGRSGRRYLFSVFSLRVSAGSEWPRYQDAVVLAVARGAHGVRQILWAGQTGGLPDLVFEGRAFTGAMAQGADEVHVHLLTMDHAGREAILRDLT